jgi:hypothetical protein
MGQTPKRKNVSMTFLCQGKFLGVIGQLSLSPINSSIPHTFKDFFMVIFLATLAIFMSKDLSHQKIVHAGSK